MRRRRFFAALGGAAVWPVGAHTQEAERVPRVGVLIGFPENDPLTQAMVTAFTRALGGLGWIEGKNIRIDRRFAAGNPSLFTSYAAELVSLSPNAILASSSPAVAVLRQQTSTIPIVFVLVVDPVGQGFVQSLARPGGFQPIRRNTDGKMAPIAQGGRAWCHADRRYLQPRHRALRPVVQPRDRGSGAVLRDDRDA